MAAAMRDTMMIQMGARRDYAYARQLEAAGLLHSLVTDAAWASADRGLPRLIARLAPRRGPAVRRRTVEGIPPQRLDSSLLPNVMSVPWPGLAKERRYALADDLLGRVAARRADGDLAVVVNYFGNGGSFLDQARARGVLIVTDFISHPDYWDIVAAERAVRPGWESGDDAGEDRAAYRARFARLVQGSDIYCCPSPAIAAALAAFEGFDPDRVRILPYGAPQVADGPTSPVPGRVLFAASAVTVAKGIAYLGEAAQLVRARFPQAEFIVAGAVPDSLRSRPELAGLHFAGPLGAQQMAAEYARTDLFCLPSLAEGSATVLFEAMARGIPCVTTAMSGSTITHGQDGLIVPERDGKAIADAVCALLEDRDRRRIMADAARACARAFSYEACGKAFVDMIASLPRKKQMPPADRGSL